MFNCIINDVCYNKDIAPKFNLLFLFDHQFVDDMLKKNS